MRWVCYSLILLLLAGCGATVEQERASRYERLVNEAFTLRAKVQSAEQKRAQYLRGAKAAGEEPDPEVLAEIGPTEEQKARLKELEAELRVAPDTDEGVAAGGRDVNEGRRLLRLLNSTDPVAGRVEGHILDSATGEPVPARVRVIDPFGVVVASQANHLGFWAPGSFGVNVLAGKVEVEISRGPGYLPFSRAVLVKPGKTTRVDVLLGRTPGAVSLRREGWHPADFHVEVMGLALPGAWTRADAALAAAAGEGVRIVGLCRPPPEVRRDQGRALPEDTGLTSLACLPLGQDVPYGEAYALAADPDAVTRTSPTAALSLGERIVAEPQAGRLVVFRHPTVTQEVDPQRQLLPMHPHLRGWYEGHGLALRGLGAELPLLLGAGVPVDLLDLNLAYPKETQLWFRLLNRGHRLPAISTDAEVPGLADLPHATTYVRLETDQQATPEAVMTALRKGRAMISQGPLIDLQLRYGEDYDQVARVGDQAPHRRRFLVVAEAHVEGRPGASLDRVELIRNGEVVLTREAMPGENAIALQIERVEQRRCWYVARVVQTRRGSDMERVGLTNPIHVGPPAVVPFSPVKTEVRGQVSIGRTGVPATVEVWLGPERRRTVMTDAQGRYSLECSPYARLLARAEGYQPAARRVFPATAADRLVRRLHTDAMGIGAEALLQGAVVDLARLHLQRAQVDFALRPDSSAASESEAEAASHSD